MSKPGAEYLQHILDETEYLLEQVRKKGRDSLLTDGTLQRAAVRSLSIIGEAAKKVPAEIKSSHPEIPWIRMTGMRDKLVHDYFGIDYEIVWDVIDNELTSLRPLLERILEEL